MNFGRRTVTALNVKKGIKSKVAVQAHINWTACLISLQYSNVTIALFPLGKNSHLAHDLL